MIHLKNILGCINILKVKYSRSRVRSHATFAYIKILTTDTKSPWVLLGIFSFRFSVNFADIGAQIDLFADLAAELPGISGKPRVSYKN